MDVFVFVPKHSVSFFFNFSFFHFCCLNSIESNLCMNRLNLKLILRIRNENRKERKRESVCMCERGIANAYGKSHNTIGGNKINNTNNTDDDDDIEKEYWKRKKITQTAKKVDVEVEVKWNVHYVSILSSIKSIEYALENENIFA